MMRASVLLLAAGLSLVCGTSFSSSEADATLVAEPDNYDNSNHQGNDSSYEQGDQSSDNGHLNYDHGDHGDYAYDQNDNYIKKHEDYESQKHLSSNYTYSDYLDDDYFNHYPTHDNETTLLDMLFTQARGRVFKELGNYLSGRSYTDDYWTAGDKVERQGFGTTTVGFAALGVALLVHLFATIVFVASCNNSNNNNNVANICTTSCDNTDPMCITTCDQLTEADAIDNTPTCTTICNTQNPVCTTSCTVRRKRDLNSGRSWQNLNIVQIAADRLKSSWIGEKFREQFDTVESSEMGRFLCTSAGRLLD